MTFTRQEAIRLIAEKAVRMKIDYKKIDPLYFAAMVEVRAEEKFKSRRIVNMGIRKALLKAVAA